MNTIIEKIRAEVERLKETAKLMKLSTYKSGWNSAMNAVLQLLSTLQEQPVSEGLEEEIRDKRKKLIEVFGPMNGEQVLALKDFARHFYELGKQEKPTPAEGLEEEVDKYLEEHFDYNSEYNSIRLKGDYFPSPQTLKDIASHFAQWGAEHYLKSEFLTKFAEMTGSVDTMPKNTLPPSKECEKGLREHLDKDLEEAANNYLDGVYGKMPHSDYHTAIFIAGAVNEREKMMKGLRSYCLDEMERFQGADEGSRAAREVYYDIIGYLDNYERR